MRLCAVIHDPVTTTDELIPSGETSSYRSNPIGLSEFTLSRRVPEYVARSKAVRSLEELLALLEGQDPDRAWVCGGGEIYRLLLPWCRTCHITRVYEAPESDAFFPDLDRLPQWRLARSEAALAHGDTAYQFLVYQAEGEGLPCRS